MHIEYYIGDGREKFVLLRDSEGNIIKGNNRNLLDFFSLIYSPTTSKFSLGANRQSCLHLFYGTRHRGLVYVPQECRFVTLGSASLTEGLGANNQRVPVLNIEILNDDTMLDSFEKIWAGSDLKEFENVIAQYFAQELLVTHIEVFEVGEVTQLNHKSIHIYCTNSFGRRVALEKFVTSPLGFLIYEGRTLVSTKSCKSGLDLYWYKAHDDAVMGRVVSVPEDWQSITTTPHGVITEFIELDGSQFVPKQFRITRHNCEESSGKMLWEGNSLEELQAYMFAD